MKYERLRYRSRQFWNALFAQPSQADLERANKILTSAQLALFFRMQRSEQAHSLKVMNKILKTIDGELNENLQDLLVAALLHDVGKTRYPLSVWERIIVVLGKILFPFSVKRWGSGQPGGWRRAFVVAEQHANWGAELASSVGTSSLAVDLIRRHQNFVDGKDVSLEAQLLSNLQVADQDS